MIGTSNFGVERCMVPPNSDGPGATDAWLKKLLDPDLTMRVTAASLLGANALA
jgi:hypothetical protein